MRLKGKTAVVTGSASGIGKEIATCFAKEGANVVIADLNEKKALETAEELRSHNCQTMGVGMNVTIEEEVTDGIKKMIQQFNHIDILVSNAGIQHIASVDKLTYSDWKKILAVHLDGSFLTTRACLQSMYESKRGGCIIYMGSVHSKEASPLKAPYVAAKHGLIGLCKVVAKEAAPYNVRANVICPGFVDTPLVRKQIPEQARDLGISEKEVIEKVMLKNTVDTQFTTTDEVAKVALFLASFNSLALTGQSIVVSHGWFMQ